MRFPARVRSISLGSVSLDLDLSAVAPGRDPRLGAILFHDYTLSRATAKELRFHNWFDVILIERQLRGDHPYSALVSLPADPDWLAWNGGTVRALAQRIRDTNDDALFPILADALEDAGCAEAELLARCRDPHDDNLDWLAVLLATQECPVWGT